VRVESGVDPVALRDARFRMGLTQHELARLINVTGGERISRWDRGRRGTRRRRPLPSRWCRQFESDAGGGLM